MEKIFTKSKFPLAPGGNLYSWEDAKTIIKIEDEGKYIISITATCENGKQNKTGDDDDLRAIIDDYEFGKFEAHIGKISWRGFGTAAAWDGASLKGGSKTVCFFMNLTKGEHQIQFQADGFPKLDKIEILQIEENHDAIEDVIFNFNEQASGTNPDGKGIPWKAFIFKNDFNSTDLLIKLVDIQATCKSAKQNGDKDGDNIKVYVNGLITHNPYAPTSKKYKNFFFSGDLSEGKSETLMIHGKEFLFSEKDFSIELWYDATPTLERVKFELIGDGKYNLGDSFDSWMAKIMEGARLPVPLWDSTLKIGKISNESLDAAKQYAKENQLAEFQGEDDEIDAYRHFTWNLLLLREFGEKNAKIITTNHELFWNKLNNKQELSRSNIMDLWNNKQGREYASKYPEKNSSGLFELAKLGGDVILNIKNVTDNHREQITKDINYE